MKRIVFFVSCDIDYTGTPIFIKNIIDNLPKDSYKIFIYTPGKVINNFFSKNVTIVEGKIKKRKISYYSELKKNLMNVVFENIDIVHLNSSNVHFANIIVNYFYKKSKIITHSHNEIRYKGNFIYKSIIRKKKNNIVKKSNVLLACSKAAGISMFLNKKFDVIMNPFDYTKYIYNKRKRELFRKKYSLENKIVLGHIGAFNNQKNQIFLIKLLQNLNDKFVLLLIGNGVNKNICKKYCLDNKINNTYFLSPQNDVSVYYSSFDILLFPSLFEGFGRVLIEAKISNLNIITSDMVEIGKYFADAALPFDLDSWKKKVEQISQNLNLRSNNINVINEIGGSMNYFIERITKYYEN